MKNYEKYNLTQNEFQLLCDFMNGKIYGFDYLNWRSNIISDLFESVKLNKLQKKWKVKINILNEKLICLPQIEFLELLNEVNLFWRVEESTYKLLGKISPQSKIAEILNSRQKFEPMICETGHAHVDFFMLSESMGHDFVIYVQDSEGNNKSVWSTSNEDLIECLLTFSDKCYFGRVQKLDNAIRYGFFDFFENN